MSEKKSIIYLLGFSLRYEDKLRNMIKILKEQIKHEKNITIVLIHDGVIGISLKSMLPPVLEELLNLQINIFAMIPDIHARGIEINALREKIKCISYEELVDLLVEIPKIVSWM